MLFGFFVSTEKTFNLVPKSSPLKDLPHLCSRGSDNFPHLLPEVRQITPPLRFLKDSSLIPLFVALSGQNTLETPSGKFHLVFYPNPSDPPLKDPVRDPVIQEYWSNLQPMVICQDLSGYYLGSLNDPRAVMFETCSQSQAQCWLLKVVSEVNESTCYGSNFEFAESKIYLRKVRS